mmetsp:Transcript_122838/g.358512  ORF Transcript_122838/g.358512 Transcript_122838/m.358512 type:complete len:335 (+) Transcript_122838:71-1075(+)
MGDGMSKAVACSFGEGHAVHASPFAPCHGKEATVCTFDEDDISNAKPSSPRNGNEGLVSTPVVRHLSNEKDDTLIIFDWDDTLLCSSAINAAQWSMPELKQLEQAVASVLEAAMELGETMIVTNGNGSWVHDSSHRFLPGLVPTLEQLTVMSARAMFEQMYPGDPFSWKRQAFRQILRCRRAHCPADGVNLVVLGDSPAEMEAAHCAAKVYEGPSLIKTVKFREAPSISQLLGQISRVAQDLGEIVREDQSMSKDLEQLRLPAHLDHLVAGPSGWKFACGRDWSSSQTFLDALFSKDDEDVPLELPDWMVQLAGKMSSWQTPPRNTGAAVLSFE